MTNRTLDVRADFIETGGTITSLKVSDDDDEYVRMEVGDKAGVVTRADLFRILLAMLGRVEDGQNTIVLRFDSR